MNDPSGITREQIDALLAFLPAFSRQGRAFVDHSAGGETTADGTLTMPYPVYCEDVLAFFQLAGAPCWSDYKYNPRQAGEMLKDDQLISTATLSKIKTMLTSCVRGERFSDGYWAHLLETGRVVKLLQRLEVLREELAD